MGLWRKVGTRYFRDEKKRGISEIPRFISIVGNIAQENQRDTV